MIMRSNSKTGYSKKELMKIIEEIDKDRHQSQMKVKNEKPNVSKGQNNSSFKN